MEKKIIDMRNVTKDYGHARGIFDVSIGVSEGECYGFLGPNGAGKTTAIRHLMGFSRPHSGEAFIKGLDTWKNAAALKNDIGYIPGEIALPDGITGEAFLKMVGKMHNVEGKSAAKPLLERFELNAKTQTREMSLGDKRKLAIVSSFLHDPGILILDEPTSGLDPIMQKEFITFIGEQKKSGKTIFLSSHIFHEVDAACDRIAIIKSGRIVSEFTADELKATGKNMFSVQFENMDSYKKFMALNYTTSSESSQRMKVKISIDEDEMNGFIKDMTRLRVKSFHQVKFSLEDYFMDFYKDDRTFEEVK